MNGVRLCNHCNMSLSCLNVDPQGTSLRIETNGGHRALDQRYTEVYQIVPSRVTR